jgi:hypothetical protein
MIVYIILKICKIMVYYLLDKLSRERRIIKMADIKYDIVEEIGAVSESSTGWTKELNLISWNNREAKYDLRDWAPDHAKMGKGITLSINELRELKKLLNNMDI